MPALTDADVHPDTPKCNARPAKIANVTKAVSRQQGRAIDTYLNLFFKHAVQPCQWRVRKTHQAFEQSVVVLLLRRSELLEEAQIAGSEPAPRTNSATRVHDPNNSEKNSINIEES